MMKKVFLWLLLILVLGAICVAVIVGFGISSIKSNDIEDALDQLKAYRPVPPDTAEETNIDTDGMAETVESEETSEIPDTEASEIDTSPEPETETVPPETAAAPINQEMTLDFQQLWKVNPEIYAWIEIEGTKVDYPVLQSADNDSKYLTTAYDGSYYIGGSLFTQSTYNSTDFNDPVTVIYGHTMRAGTLFGQLQQIYTSSSTFSEYSEIKIYLPNEVRYYTVFAAVPHDPIHILHTYDFTNDYWYKIFFDNVFNIRAFGANFNSDIVPEPGDRVLILSTCLNEDSTKRFLVMAIHQDDISDN